MVEWFKGRAQLVVERERAEVVSTLQDMYEVSRRSAEEAGVARQDAGITESLQTPEQVQEGIQEAQQQQPVMVDTPEPLFKQHLLNLCSIQILIPVLQVHVQCYVLQ